MSNFENLTKILVSRETSILKSLTEGNFHARIQFMTASNHRNLRVRVRPYLAALESRTTTNRDVAALLGCNEQTLCRVLKGLAVKKVAPVDRKAASELSKARKQFREEVANRPGITPEEAAKICGVSARTIYRYIKK